MEMWPLTSASWRLARAALVLTFATFTGCVTASVASRPLAPEELTAPIQGQTLEGVIYFPPRPYLLVYHYTQFDGSALKPPVPSDTGKCVRVVQKTEFEVLPDFAHPRIMVPVRHGIGTARLSVTLSNGMITAVNADGASTLNDAIKALAGSYADVLNATKGVLMPPPAPGVRMCNVGAVLTAIVPIDWSGSAIVPLRDSSPR